MQLVTLAILCAVTLGTYFTSLHALPAMFKYLPEGFSILAAIAVILAGPAQRFRLIAPRYWIVFGAIAVIMICGGLTNDLDPGPLMEGVRYYLRALPMFFLPAIFAVNEKNVRTQLRLLLAIALVQIPLSIHQRYHVYSIGHNSGDSIFGTLMISSIESIFLISVVCVAGALALRGRLNKFVFFLLFVLLVIPTTINETKGSLFLLPVGLLTTLVVGSARGKRLRVGIAAIALVGVFGALFVPIYDFFSTTNNRYPYTLEDFFSNQKFVGHYLEKDAGVGSRGDVGRVDSMVVPFEHFANDPVHLLLGVGIGNASGSSLVGTGGRGAYYSLLGRYTECTSGSAFMVEIGVLGLALVLLLYWMIVRDAVAVAAHDRTIIGALALGWVGVTSVIVMATFYKNIHAFESLSYIFWYFSGVIAATRTRLELSVAEEHSRLILSAPAGHRA
ncbi:MAG TPA: hypothetical protein VMG11_12245 [Steroidobacteraceae bacterium]|nr:hypothetical protein [Steroidobacteraceae bacterium]